MNSLKYKVGMLSLWLVLGSCVSEKTVDWYPYYKTNRTEPYGLYIFNEEIDKMIPQFSKVERLRRGVGSLYSAEYELNNDNFEFSPNTLVYIDDANKMNTKSREAVLNYAYDGNYVFISSHDFDFLEFYFDECNYYRSFFYFPQTSDTVCFSLEGSGVKAYSDKITSLEYFDIVDTNWAVPLGYFYDPANPENKKCNFLAISYGYGIIFMHTNPEVFTNHFLLEGNNWNYVEKVISRWSQGNVRWFVNYAHEFDGEYSLLSYIMGQPALKYAWYLLWILLGFAIFTYAKRMQRVIPVVLPKKNYTVEYAKNISEFHLQEKNYHGLIEKQILVILDKLRTDHRLDISNIDSRFADSMHKALNCNLEEAEEFVAFIKKQRERTIAFSFDFEELRKILDKLNL